MQVCFILVVVLLFFWKGFFLFCNGFITIDLKIWFVWFLIVIKGIFLDLLL